MLLLLAHVVLFMKFLVVFFLLYFMFPKKYKKELCSLQNRLHHIVDTLCSCYSEIPLDICKQLQDVQLSLQRAEERVRLETQIKNFSATCFSVEKCFL